MSKTALLIIAQQGFQDKELEGTRNGLLEAGFQVQLASSDAGECMGKFGGKEQAEFALRDVNIKNFDRIGFIGGPGAEGLIENPEAHRIARETVAAGKPLGAICIAPLILASAGLLENIHATCWDDGKDTQKKFLADHGAIVEEKDVVIDGNIITGNGPAAAVEFGKRFASIT